MDKLYTKEGVPLRVRGDRVYNPDGDHFGYVKGEYVFAIDGDYRGTIVGDRLVCRSQHSGKRGASRGTGGSIGSSGAGHRGISGIQGDEPNIRP